MRFVSGLFTLLLFLMLAAGGMAALLYHQFETPGPLAVSRVIAVPKGEGRIAIATRLEREGADSNRWAFIANYLLRGAIGPKPLELKAGDYEIKKNASMARDLNSDSHGSSSHGVRCSPPNAHASGAVANAK